MPVEVACPNCQTKLRAPDGMAGRKARCKKCSTPFVIPGADTAASEDSTMMLSSFDALSAPADPARAATATPAKAAAPAKPAAPAVTAKPAAAVPPTKPAAPAKPAAPVAEAPAKPAATAPAKPAAPPAEAPAKPAGEPASIKPAPTRAAAAKASPEAPPGKKAAPALEPDAEPLPLEDEEPPSMSEADTAFDFSVSSGGKEAKKPAKTAKAGKAKPSADSVADNPFAITQLLAPETLSEKAEKERRRKAAEEAAETGEGGPRYRGPTRGGSNRMLIIAGIVGLVAILGGASAIIAMIDHRKKEAEIRRQDEEKRKAAENPQPPPADPTPPAPTPAAPVAPKPPVATPAPAVPTPPAPKASVAPIPANGPAAPTGGPPVTPAKGITPAPKAEVPPKNLGQQPIPGALSLPKTVKEFGVQPPGKKAISPINQPAFRVEVNASFDALKRVFPPEEDAEKFAVLYQTGEAGLGKPQQMLLERFFQGSRQGTLKVEGDGKAPVCDLSHDATHFANINAGKLSVYDISDQAPIADPFDVYGRPEFLNLRTGGVVAVYFSQNPFLVATVAATGDVQMWDVKNARLLGTFSPPAPAPAIPVDHRAVSLEEGRKNVLVGVNGEVYSVPFPTKIPEGNAAITPAKITETAKKNLGGPCRYLAIARQSGSDQRMIVAIETVGETPQKAILRFKNGEANPYTLRWPKDIGNPVAAAWTSTFVAVVVTDTGAAIIFNDEEKFGASARLLPAGKGQQIPTRGQDKHWFALPDPKDNTKTIVCGVEMPWDGFSSLDSIKGAETVQPVTN